MGNTGTSVIQTVEHDPAAGPGPAVQIRHLRKTYGPLVAVDDVFAVPIPTTMKAVGLFRAAGNAMARNPVPIIVPCHRVLRSGGALGGYGGGPETKRWLLGLERSGFGS